MKSSHMRGHYKSYAESLCNIYFVVQEAKVSKLSYKLKQILKKYLNSYLLFYSFSVPP